MDIRGAATIGAGIAIGAAGIGLGVLAGRHDQQDLYSPFKMAAGGPVGLIGNGTFVLGIGGLVGASAIGTRLGHIPGSGPSAVAGLIAGLGAGPGAWLAASLVSRDD
jgi:hypothetical protein